MDFLSTHFIGKVSWPLGLLIWSVICLAISFILLYLSGDRPRLRTFKTKTVNVIAYSLAGIGAAVFYIGIIWLFIAEPIIASCLIGAIIIVAIGCLYWEERRYPKELYFS